VSRTCSTSPCYPPTLPDRLKNRPQTKRPSSANAKNRPYANPYEISPPPVLPPQSNSPSALRQAPSSPDASSSRIRYSTCADGCGRARRWNGSKRASSNSTTDIHRPCWTALLVRPLGMCLEERGRCGSSSRRPERMIRLACCLIVGKHRHKWNGSRMVLLSALVVWWAPSS
jgi:hypothetical protein